VEEDRGLWRKPRMERRELCEGMERQNYGGAEGECMERQIERSD
jgi:hypothetical protein